MKKRTYIVKLGIRFYEATTDRGLAFQWAQQLEASGGKGRVHVWSRPYRGPVDQLVEEDFWADADTLPAQEPEEEPKTYCVLREGAIYSEHMPKAAAEGIRGTLLADGIEAEVVEEEG